MFLADIPIQPLFQSCLMCTGTTRAPDTAQSQRQRLYLKSPPRPHLLEAGEKGLEKNPLAKIHFTRPKWLLWEWHEKKVLTRAFLGLFDMDLTLTITVTKDWELGAAQQFSPASVFHGKQPFSSHSFSAIGKQVGMDTNPTFFFGGGGGCKMAFFEEKGQRGSTAMQPSSETACRWEHVLIWIELWSFHVLKKSLQLYWVIVNKRSGQNSYILPLLTKSSKNAET